jgi:trk system potassium uptake protein TrkH
MTRLDAACHTFSTMGTGGFSTRNLSVAAFDSPAIELVITFFMLVAGINFTMHYRLLVERKPGRFFGDVEIRAYLIITALATIAIVAGPGQPGQSPAGDADGAVSDSIDHDHDRFRF